MTGRFYTCPRCGRLLVTASDGGEIKHGTIDNGECKED